MNSLGNQIAEFSRKLEVAKAQVPELEGKWYPYGSLNNFGIMDLVVPDGWLAFGERLRGTRIADIGAADGESAFFLEQFGISVDIIDNGPTNFNGLRGAWALKRELKSNVDIYEIDLDEQFKLPRDYEFVLFLGILYHLKNPFYVLEKLALKVRRIVMSTRICTHDRVGGTMIRDIPVAYLVGPYENNNDPTNYWMFTHAGLLRILDRSGWEVRRFHTVGATAASDPFSRENDERAFVYAESRL